MTQGEMVKAIRTYFDLTMEKFGERIGVSKSSISNIENGNRSLTEHMTKSICREFNVDYLWLTTGEGNMFLEVSMDDELTMYVQDMLDDCEDHATAELMKRMVVTYYKLDDKSKTVLDSFISEILDNKKEKH